MGQIKEQAIIGTIYAYFGIGIGFIIAEVLFPNYLETVQIGLLGILVSYSMIFAQYGSLGVNMVTLKYFPLFNNKKLHHHGFFPLLFLASTLGFILAIITFFILKSFLLKDVGDKSGLFEEYINYLIPFIFVTLFFNFFDNYLRALYNAVLGTIMKEIVQRVLVLIGIALFILGFINFKIFVLIYVMSYCLPTVILLGAIYIKGEFTFKIDWAFFDKKLAKQMIYVALFGIIGGFTSMVLSNVDRIVLQKYMGLGDVGIYLTVFYFASMISVPSRSLIKIATPHVSDALKNEDQEKLSDIYHKSSLTQLIVGLLILVLIWANVENIFHFLPKAYGPGKYVILLAGLAFLTDMASGSASDIISNSSRYRVTSYLLIFLVVLVIITCIIFVPMFGLTGAALAVLISKLINNIAKYWYVKKVFKLDPYNNSFLIVLGIGVLSYSLTFLIPDFTNIYIDSMIRTTIISLVYIYLSYITKVSPDLNQSLYQLKEIVIRFLKRRNKMDQ